MNPIEFIKTLGYSNQQIADLVVEAGVLEQYVCDHNNPAVPIYAVVQPHVHEWRVVQCSSEREVCVNCNVCGDDVWLPNRLPIKVPE